MRHSASLLRRGAAGIHGLVRRDIVGNYQQLIRRKLRADGLCRLKMPQMRRVEASAVYRYLHFFLSFTSTIFGSFSLRL